MSDTSKLCVFCTLPADRILGQNEQAVWIRDGLSVSQGHSLVIPKRHFVSFFKESIEERQAMLELVDVAKQAAQMKSGPDGYNIGINDGPDAGQIIPHLH
jgi:diadenosine tetraphosphate (Ap4A) HIT family hydrolase